MIDVQYHHPPTVRWWVSVYLLITLISSSVDVSLSLYITAVNVSTLYFPSPFFAFGVRNFDVSSSLVRASPDITGCSSLDPSMSGHIVWIEPFDCSIETKIRFCQKAGCLAAISSSSYRIPGNEMWTSWDGTEVLSSLSNNHDAPLKIPFLHVGRDVAVQIRHLLLHYEKSLLNVAPSNAFLPVPAEQSNETLVIVRLADSDSGNQWGDAYHSVYFTVFFQCLLGIAHLCVLILATYKFTRYWWLKSVRTNFSYIPLVCLSLEAAANLERALYCLLDPLGANQIIPRNYRLALQSLSIPWTYTSSLLLVFFWHEALSQSDNKVRVHLPFLTRLKTPFLISAVALQCIDIALVLLDGFYVTDRISVPVVSIVYSVVSFIVASLLFSMSYKVILRFKYDAQRQLKANQLRDDQHTKQFQQETQQYQLKLYHYHKQQLAVNYNNNNDLTQQLEPKRIETQAPSAWTTTVDQSSMWNEYPLSAPVPAPRISHTSPLPRTISIPLNLSTPLIAPPSNNNNNNNINNNNNSSIAPPSRVIEYNDNDDDENNINKEYDSELNKSHSKNKRHDDSNNDENEDENDMSMYVHQGSRGHFKRLGDASASEQENDSDDDIPILNKHLHSHTAVPNDDYHHSFNTPDAHNNAVIELTTTKLSPPSPHMKSNFHNNVGVDVKSIDIMNNNDDRVINPIHTLQLHTNLRYAHLDEGDINNSILFGRDGDNIRSRAAYHRNNEPISPRHSHIDGDDYHHPHTNIHYDHHHRTHRRSVDTDFISRDATETFNCSPQQTPQLASTRTANLVGDPKQHHELLRSASTLSLASCSSRENVELNVQRELILSQCRYIALSTFDTHRKKIETFRLLTIQKNKMIRMCEFLALSGLGMIIFILVTAAAPYTHIEFDTPFAAISESWLEFSALLLIGASQVCAF